MLFQKYYTLEKFGEQSNYKASVTYPTPTCKTLKYVFFDNYFQYIIQCKQAQLAFTCSKTTMETAEQCVRSAQSYQYRKQRHHYNVIEVVLVSLLLTFNRFHVDWLFPLFTF